MTSYSTALQAHRQAATVTAAYFLALSAYRRWVPPWMAEIMACASVLTAFTRVYGRSQA